ncbi:MAG TPA: hypothetical protein VFN27_15550 [Xanthobacteraceae bacterium]|nr:hypothetical protein [Xanthobacteraceae bacterium]
MDWTVFVMIGGVCVSAAAFAFGLIYVLPRARTARRGSADEERCNGLRELCLAVVIGGVVLISVGTIANDVRFAPAPVNPVIFLGVGAFFVWQCGFWLGRVSLRLRPSVADVANSDSEA